MQSQILIYVAPPKVSDSNTLAQVRSTATIVDETFTIFAKNFAYVNILEQHIFTSVIDYGGTNEKVLQILIPLK